MRASQQGKRFVDEVESASHLFCHMWRPALENSVGHKVRVSVWKNMVLSRGGQGVVILRGIVVTSTVSDQVGQCARVRDTRHHTACYEGKNHWSLQTGGASHTT